MDTTVATKPLAETKRKNAKKTMEAKPHSVAKKQLTILGEDEKATREMRVIDDRHVDATFTVRASEKSKQRYVIATRFDFSQCTQAEILQLAVAQCRIAAQARFRAMGEPERLEHDTWQKINVKSDIIDTQRLVVDGLTRSIRSLARETGLSEPEVRAMVERDLIKRGQ
jgi:hypothetical protein